ncbi:MAG: heat-inducible transcriptional repressor HrcA [Deltaproteobacteria bacterium]|nr:heat-inducible transcriptional repressor HrcA [Deltaproteobacteria bacterium]
MKDLIKEKMDQRANLILEHIITIYVQTGEPVGSRALSKKLNSKLSAATIRNVMADLTEMGYIVQPHTSAGRIPTDKGYRYHVNRIAQEKPMDVAPLKNGPSGTQPISLEEILLNAIKELAHITSYAGLVIAPQPALSRLKKIEFIHLSPTQAMVVLITQSGLVRNKVIHLRECPDQDSLDKMSRVLDDLFSGLSLMAIRNKLVETLTEENKSHSNLLALAIRLGKRAFDIKEQGDLFISGQSNMCAYPEFYDQRNLKIIYEILEDKDTLADILEEAITQDHMQIKIGYENKRTGLDHCSVITTTYGNRNYNLGSIGVIGPTRMNYPKVISAIGYTSQRLTFAVSHFIENNDT